MHHFLITWLMVFAAVPVASALLPQGCIHDPATELHKPVRAHISRRPRRFVMIKRTSISGYASQQGSRRTKARQTIKMQPFFTVGHSTHTMEEFVALLHDVRVELVVDVRTVPRSRKNPQYNRETLPVTLKEFNLGYVHIARLGGRRSRQPIAPDVNGFWHNESFHNYADYALGEEFHAGLNQLRELGHSKRAAIMCAEAVWWRCHRRIIADYLIVAGETVIHILAKGRTERARISEAAVPGPDLTLTYPPTGGG